MTSAVQWGIVGLALGVVPTYVMMEERARKESAAAAAAAASTAAAAVYAAWSATPPVVCPPPPVTVPTVVAITNAGGGAPHGPTRIDPPKDSKDVDDAKMLLPMLNMAQGMMNDNGASGGGPDINEVMKNLPRNNATQSGMKSLRVKTEASGTPDSSMASRPPSRRSTSAATPATT